MPKLTIHNVDPETEKRVRERAARNCRSLNAELREILREAVGTQEAFVNLDKRPVVVRFVQTCSAYPEQYDAFIGEEKIGYLRLRHGHFRVECPDVFGETVFEASPNGDGFFDDDERGEYLEAAQDAIADWWRERGVRPACA